MIEDGDVDIIMARNLKLNHNQVGQVNVIYYDKQNNKTVDRVSVNGIVGHPFNLGYYKNDLPVGYSFVGVSKKALKFDRGTQNVMINVQKTSAKHSKYGKITIHFVKADAKGVSSAVNGNQATSDQTLQNYEVPGSLDEVMTGRVGDLFSPEKYEHNTPQGTTFDHIVKGNDIDMITANDQNIWIAVKAING